MVLNFLMDEYRLVFVVNTDLKMGKGKVISQCMHGLDGIYERLDEMKNNMFGKILIKKWRMSGSAKIVLKASGEEIQKIEESLRESKNLIYYSVCDAGRTQVEPGSNTVIAIGPGPKEEIEKYTKDLKLY